MSDMKTNDYTLDDGTPWRLYKPDNAKDGWVVLWLQGFTSTIEGHSEGCMRMSRASGVSFAILNYAGHGNHSTPLEQATRKQQFDEVVTVYDELKTQGFTHIIAIGGSFGAYMGALLSGERELAGLVLRAPAIYADEEYGQPFAETRSGKTNNRYRTDTYRATVTPESTNAALNAVREYSGDVYVIEHELDEAIPANVPKAYYAVAQHGNYIVVRGSKHSPKLMDNASQYFSIIEGWVETMVSTIIKQSELNQK